jgi:hypothetical protein
MTTRRGGPGRAGVPTCGCRPCLSVRHPARRPRARGRIADSDGSESRLGTRKRSSLHRTRTGPARLPPQGDWTGARLTIVFAGLAVSRWSRARPAGRSGSVKVARRDRIIEARVVRQAVAAGLLPGDFHKAINAVSAPVHLREGCPTQARSCCGLETYLSCTSLAPGSSRRSAYPGSARPIPPRTAPGTPISVSG